MFGGNILKLSIWKWIAHPVSPLTIPCLGFLLLAGCSVGPKYVKPTTDVPPAYKDAGNWKAAQPSDEARKGNWWEMFQDSQLNSLEDKLSVSNQTLRAANDRFTESRAAVRISRSAKFPLVTAGSSINQYRESLNKTLASPTAPVYYSDFLVSGGDVSYEADVWGRVRHVVESTREQSQATAAQSGNDPPEPSRRAGPRLLHSPRPGRAEAIVRFKRGRVPESPGSYTEPL